MINITAKFDVRDVIKQIKDIQDKQPPFATSLAINRTAQKVKAREEQMIEAAKKHGFNPVDDNEADAIHILRYVMEPL